MYEHQYAQENGRKKNYMFLSQAEGQNLQFMKGEILLS